MIYLLGGHGLHTLIKGSIFDTECDLIIVPCSTSGGVSGAIWNGLATNNLIPEKHKKQSGFEYGEVYFYRVAHKNTYVTVGFAACVDDISLEIRSKKKIECISQIMNTIIKYAKANSIKKINAPLLATGGGHLPVVDSYNAMITPFMQDGEIELCVCAVDADKFENIQLHKGGAVIMPKENKPLVFISYSRKDKEKVSIFASHLVQNNYDVWIDSKDIYPGDSIIFEIADGLSKADIYVVFISFNSNNSKWVTEELNIALTLSIENKKPLVVPVLLDDCEIPQLLIGRLYLDARFSIQGALQQFSDKLTVGDSLRKTELEIPNKPILTGIKFSLSKNTNIAVGGTTSFTREDLVHERESIQKELRKRANGILMNFVPLSDFDLKSAIPKYKNGMYVEQVETVPGPFDSSICERVIVQATIFNPEKKKIDELVQNKLDKLHTTSLTYEFSVPLNGEGFDKRCIQKIQDNYPIISYDYDDGAMIEYEGNLFISVKCSLEHISIKIHTAYDYTFSQKAASFNVIDFITWLAKQ